MRPMVEYAAQVWHVSLTDEQCDKVGVVQHSSLRTLLSFLACPIDVPSCTLTCRPSMTGRSAYAGCLLQHC